MNRILSNRSPALTVGARPLQTFGMLANSFTGRACHFGDFFVWKSAFTLLRFYADFKEWSYFEWGELVLTFCHCWRWPLVDMVFNIWFHTSTHLLTDNPNCHQAQASLGRFLDRRTSSVQDASCAASDAQGRLNRLQEQSRTVPGSGRIDSIDGYGWRERKRENFVRHTGIDNEMLPWYARRLRQMRLMHGQI